MRESKELISIIVPIYNRESVLKKCIESVLNQTYKNIQLILVDDGSTDNSLSVCQNYAKNDSRILVLFQNNSGPSSARNAGLDIAKGKYVMFVDSDDCIHRSCVEILYGAIQKFNVGVAMCDYSSMYLSDQCCKRMHTVLLNTKAVLNNGFNEKGNAFYGCGKLWKMSIIKNIRFKSFSFCEDTLFNIEAFLNYEGDVVHVTNGSLYYYLQKEDSITKKLSDKNLLDSLDVLGIILKRTGLLTVEINESLHNYSVSTAFFAYLKASDEKFGGLVKDRAIEIIQRYRTKVLFCYSSSLKVKVACLVSFFSMNLVKHLYGLIKQ